MLQGTVRDVRRLVERVQTDPDCEYLLTDALDDLEVELFGGPTFSVATLSALLREVSFCKFLDGLCCCGCCFCWPCGVARVCVANYVGGGLCIRHS